MNDPHVEALIFRVEHGPAVKYDNAEPLNLEHQHFTVRVDANIATFTMTTHYTNACDALAVVEPFIHAWELSVGLERGPEDFHLVYDRPEIIDWNPTPEGRRSGNISGVSQLMLNSRGTPTAHRSSYPQPQIRLAVDPDVKSMYDRYTGHLQGKEPLASMAYFCVTVLLAGKRRDVAAKKYRISACLLSKLSRLVTEKGGREARKASGADSEFTPHDRIWIDATIKAIIRRAAEVAYDPRQKLPQISIADLPQLD